jgi:Na+-translocating ferredoxin:NAD+ oxidoreductase RnfA subunit
MVRMESVHHQCFTQNKGQAGCNGISKCLATCYQMSIYVTQLMLGWKDSNVTATSLLFKAKISYLVFVTFRFSVSRLVSMTELCVRFS